MPRISFTPHLQRHLDCPPASVAGGSVREALEAVFGENPRLRGYVLDDRGRLRKHVSIFVNGERVGDPAGLTDTVDDAAEIYVMQALSGG